VRAEQAALSGARIRVRAEADFEGLAPFAVGRIISPFGPLDGFATGQRVLVGCPNSSDAEFDAAPGAILPIDDGLAAQDALLLPHAARALRIWRLLQLEIGEAAVFTGGTAFGRLLGLMASWGGALPVVHLASGPDASDSFHTVNGSTLSAVEELRSRLAAAPGVAAVDTTGHGDLLRILLEALPRWGRLMLAGPGLEPFATDFYTDIHRRALTVCSGPNDAASGLADVRGWNADFDRAKRLLTDANRAAQLRACGLLTSVDRTVLGPAV